eukprot:CAMPEP_0197421758 /NCGR_PEP_ID=MMETSP1170-20131217/10942_1 /TAXON_ID=54406 /ORGANISM="Sarcinochrysis sp, Strain CCMP770" /LENGTH=141 /DNA_ID=CAMNT_0042949035 /DNA_START=43 /DNA_END=468 /DNA_ORIENTATION=+
MTWSSLGVRSATMVVGGARGLGRSSSRLRRSLGAAWSLRGASGSRWHTTDPAPSDEGSPSTATAGRRKLTVDKDFHDFLADAQASTTADKPQAAAADEDEMEDMFVDTAMGQEWGGPMRGGRHPEPTRFGDWERKGRVTDF